MSQSGSRPRPSHPTKVRGVSRNHGPYGFRRRSPHGGTDWLVGERIPRLVESHLWEEAAAR